MKVRHGGSLVAVMRKLAVALYHVGVRNEEFQPRRLFGRIGRRSGRSAERIRREQASARKERRDQLTRGGDVAWADGTGKVVRSWLLENC